MRSRPIDGKSRVGTTYMPSHACQDKDFSALPDTQSIELGCLEAA